MELTLLIKILWIKNTISHCEVIIQPFEAKCKKNRSTKYDKVGMEVKNAKIKIAYRLCKTKPVGVSCMQIFI